MSIRDRLKDKATTGGEGPPAVDWTREGQEVAGVVTQVKEGINTVNGVASLIVLDDEVTGEPLSVWTSGAVLSALHEDYEVSVGDEVYIRHEGMTQPKGNGNPYRSFAIAHERGDRNAPAPSQGSTNDAPAPQDDDLPF